MSQHMEMDVADFNSLPEGCITSILSLTTPRGLCSSSAVSSSFRSAADSNAAWERFLPSDYQMLLLSSTSPVQYGSTRELYFKLCNSILIDEGKKSFWLEKATGKKCYMLSARDLSITWANDPMYWCWKPLPHESRFAEVVELRTICWLEIHGRISSGLLSRNTNYAAYLIVRITNRAYGLDSIPSETSIEIGNHTFNNTACLRSRGNDEKQIMLKINEGNGRVPCERKDGWMEIELGEFYINGGDDQGEVRMSLTEVKGGHLKGGLVVEGIEVRPKE